MNKTFKVADLLALHTPTIELADGLTVQLRKYTWIEEIEINENTFEASASAAYIIDTSDVGKPLSQVEREQYKEVQKIDEKLAGLVATLLQQRVVDGDAKKINAKFVMNLTGTIRDIIIYGLKTGELPDEYKQV